MLDSNIQINIMWREFSAFLKHLTSFLLNFLFLIFQLKSSNYFTEKFLKPLINLKQAPSFSNLVSICHKINSNLSNLFFTESSDSESFENFSNDPESELEIFEEPQHDNKSVLVTASVETSNNLEVVSDSVSDTSTPSSISTMKNEEIESLKSSSISEVPSFLLKSSNDLNLDTNIPELADDEKRHQFQDRIKMFNQIQN